MPPTKSLRSKDLSNDLLLHEQKIRKLEAELAVLKAEAAEMRELAETLRSIGWYP